MKRFLFCLALMTLGLGRAEVPKLFTERAFTSVLLAEAVNHYVAIGEAASQKEWDKFLAEDAARANWRFSRGFSVDERISWVCRIVNQPRSYDIVNMPRGEVLKIPDKNNLLRGPQFGGLKIPENTMPLEKWPLYPLALSGSTYLVLNENYTPNGVPESLEHYIDYCKSNGVFRITPVPVPSREQALKDAAALRQSQPWQDIKWVDKDGSSYPLGEQWTFGYIESQVKNIPAIKIVKKQTGSEKPTVTLSKF